MAKWQKINSAPKDGTVVLLYSKWEANPVFIGFRTHDGKWRSEGCDGMAILSSTDFGTEYQELPEDGPTHWQPLPSPPEEE